MGDTVRYHTGASAETAECGKNFGISLVKQWGKVPHSHACVVCCFGDLGAGKTTFIQGIGISLGITTRLLSPTFIIVRRYDISQEFTYLYHIDLYRFGEGDSQDTLGLSEIFSDPKSLVCIEWAEKLPKLPKHRIECHFYSNADGSHDINIASYGN